MSMPQSHDMNLRAIKQFFDIDTLSMTISTKFQVLNTPTSFLGGCHIRPPIVKHPTKKVVDQFWHNL